MRLLIDAQLPPRLADWLREQGLDAVHVSEVGLLSADDRTIWLAAQANGQALVTKDRDFVDWAIATPDGPQVVWIRSGNAGNATLIVRLAALLPDITQALADGVRVIETGRLQG